MVIYYFEMRIGKGQAERILIAGIISFCLLRNSVEFPKGEFLNHSKHQSLPK